LSDVDVVIETLSCVVEPSEQKAAAVVVRVDR